MVVVEVRQGTLGVDGRGWGPAENTVDRGSQLSKDDEDDEEDEEEEERRTRQEEAEEEKEEEATDIKSNNPHLAGGEQTQQQELERGIVLGEKFPVPMLEPGTIKNPSHCWGL